MSSKTQTVLFTLGILVFVSIISLSFYSALPDYSLRGTPVKVGGQLGYILSSDRDTILNFHQVVEVMYIDGVGCWHTERFPNELVHPYSNSPITIPGL